MGDYRDYIPDKAFLVKPDYETRSVVEDGVTYSRNYFKSLKIGTYATSFKSSKYNFTTTTPVIDTTTEYNASSTYQKGSRVAVYDYSSPEDPINFGVIYEAGTDVPLDNNPLNPKSVDESGVPYWVEADTIKQLRPFDGSTKTELNISSRGFKITETIFFYILPLLYEPQQQLEHISIMGIKGSGSSTKAYVQFYHADIAGLIGYFNNPVNQCNFYNAAIIDTFEIDLMYRDRISFEIPELIAKTPRPSLPEIDHTNGDEDTNIMLFNGGHIAVDIYIESTDQAFLHAFAQTPCGAVGVDPLKDLSIGFVTVGKKNTLGLTQFDMSLGRVVKRASETNYLKRRTILSATETFKCDISVENIVEHLRADYFFRVASETSHIIHAGAPDYDWRFIFGILDGNSPIDNPSENILHVNGFGAAFFATDPLTTQQVPQGWA